MPRTILSLVTFIMACCLSELARGQPEAGGFYTLNFSVNGGPGHQTNVLKESQPVSVGEQQVIFNDDFSPTFQTSSGTGEIGVSAVTSTPQAPFLLGVSAVAGAIQGSTTPAGTVVQTAANAFARVTDKKTFRRQGGSGNMKVEGVLRLSGSQSAISSANGSLEAQARVSLSVDVNDQRRGSSSAIHFSPSGISTSLPPPTIVDYSMAVTPNVPVDFKVQMFVGSLAGVTHGFVGQGGDGAALVEGKFNNTLTWGGITRVTDALTGEPIEGWSVESESGFDYSQVIVPEPATLILFSIAFAALAFPRPQSITPRANGLDSPPCPSESHGDT